METPKTETQIRHEKHLLIASCPQLVLNRTEAQDIAVAVKSGLTDTIHRVVLCFVSLEGASGHGMTFLARELTEVIRLRGKIHLVGHHSLERSVREQGLDRMFDWSDQLQRVLIAEGILKPAAKSAADFLNATITAVSSTLQKMLKSPVCTGKVLSKSALAQTAEMELGAVLPLKSTFFSGNLYVGFTRQMYSNLLSRLTGHPVSELDPGYASGAGKVLSLIQGEVRKALSHPEFGVSPTNPWVLAPDDVESTLERLPPTALFIPFSSDAGVFWIVLVAGVHKAAAGAPGNAMAA